MNMESDLKVWRRVDLSMREHLRDALGRQVGARAQFFLSGGRSPARVVHSLNTIVGLALSDKVRDQ